MLFRRIEGEQSVCGFQNTLWLRVVRRPSILWASEEVLKCMGLTDDETAYRMLRPQDSTKFLQKVFSKERQSVHGEELTEDRNVALKEADRVR